MSAWPRLGANRRAWGFPQSTERQTRFGESVKKPLNRVKKEKTVCALVCRRGKQLFSFLFWKCANRSSATSKRCRWSTHDALARARAQKQPAPTRKSFQMSERKAVIKNADMSEVRVRRVTRYRAVSVASARGNGMPLRAVFSSPREIEHLPATAPSAALDRPWDARLTAFIPPHCCFANNRTSSRMPWTAPPRCVSSRLESVGFWN